MKGLLPSMVVADDVTVEAVGEFAFKGHVVTWQLTMG